MTCLVNKKRFEHSFPALAQHADLIQYAQSVAEYLSTTKATVINSTIVSPKAASLPVYNASNWFQVQHSFLQKKCDVVSAQWTFETNVATLGNMLRYDYVYFGSGYSSGYMVQVFGKPVFQPPVSSDLFPACPANETFSAWVYPEGIPDEPLFNNTLVGELYPWTNDTKLNRDDGRWGATLEPKSIPDIPYVTSLDVVNNVASANSSTPYVATDESGPKGMSKDDLNLMVCLINARRYESCLPPVALHSSLNTAAQRHSYMMARNSEISHYDRSGTIGQRFTRYGLRYSIAAENVASGFHTLYSAYVGWLESQGHLNNILIPEAVYMGAGMNGIFWTNNFASLMDTSLNPKDVPMCPGNKTARLIAFPDGVPETTPH
ncbi:hypothetical protein EC988_002487 [Linderina pennispora]|nr:hypothetical protein EC988_002487 [Linderina pennispora]